MDGFISHIANMEDVGILDNNIIHVNAGGIEPAEITRKGDEINGGMFVELEEIRVTLVLFPP